MPIIPGGAYYSEFVTSSFSTGAATTADSLPAATANHNGSDDGSFALAVANLDTGRYKITGTVPAGYSAGDIVFVTVAATVGGVAGKGVVDSFAVGPATVIVGSIANGAITDAAFTVPPETAGRPTTLLAMLRRLWEWTANARQRSRSTGTVTLSNAAGNATLETQTQSTTNQIDTQSQGG